MDYTAQYAVRPSTRPEKIHKSEWLHRCIANTMDRSDMMGAESVREFFDISE
jgi:hypothetical protein